MHRLLDYKQPVALSSPRHRSPAVRRLLLTVLYVHVRVRNPKALLEEAWTSLPPSCLPRKGEVIFCRCCPGK